MRSLRPCDRPGFEARDVAARRSLMRSLRPCDNRAGRSLVALENGAGVGRRLLLVLRSAAAVALLFYACLCATGCDSPLLATTERALQEAAAHDDGHAAASQAAPQPAAQGAPVPDETHVAVVIDSANAAAYNDKFPASLGAFLVEAEEGDTALSVLKKTGVEVGMSGRSYVKSIGGVAEKTCGPLSGWLYLVDGKQPMVDSSSYPVQPGQTVQWVFTVEEGDVPGAGMGT